MRTLSSCRTCSTHLSAFILSLLNDDLEFEVLTRRARSHKFIILSLFFKTIRIQRVKGDFCTTSHRAIIAKHLTNLKVLFPPAVIASDTPNFRKPSKTQTAGKHLRVSLLSSVYSFSIACRYRDLQLTNIRVLGLSHPFFPLPRIAISWTKEDKDSICACRPG